MILKGPLKFGIPKCSLGRIFKREILEILDSLEIKQLWIRPCLSFSLLLARFCLLAFQRIARSCCNRHLDAPLGFFWPHRRFFYNQNLLIFWSQPATPLVARPTLTLVTTLFCSWSPPPSSLFLRLHAFDPAAIFFDPLPPTFTTFSRFVYLSLVARSLFKTSMHL